MTEDSRAERSRLTKLGRAIRRARDDLTQEELGLRLGAPQTTVSRWELGTVDLGVEQVCAIETALGLPSGRLLIEGGYVDSSTVAQAAAPSGVVVFDDSFSTLHEALRAVRAAERLYLGVSLRNEWKAHPTGDDEFSMWWQVTTFRDAPGMESA